MRETLDEFEIIRIIVETIGQPKPRFSRIGDDVAYLPKKRGKVVIKSDMLVEKTDVPKGMNLWQVSRKSIVMCVSDFAAKGVIPSAALISLGIPRGMGEWEIRELAKGFKEAKEEFGIEILGGDTNEAEGLVIDCCMIGFADRIVERKGAKPGDLVITSGFFGYSSSGLKIMLNSLKAEHEFRERAISAVVMPNPRLRLGVALSKKNLISSSIDSSDGLALSLYEIATHSKVGIEIDNLPTTDDVKNFAEMNNLSLNDLVLYGGEEYEIVATIPRDKLNKTQRLAKRIGERIIAIGKVTNDFPKVHLSLDERETEIERRGWIHLK
ncbi:MAG: thiamine-phosphate kinase [archaeon]|nr:thiamine-phosphate kinase [archaeon]MCP8319738.1 thiamine-phosphate kinase [archaeon]